MALHRFIERKYGMKTRSITNPNDVVQCEITVTEYLQNNPDRLGYILMNLGDFPMYVIFDEHPSDVRGLLLAAAGGIMSLDAERDYELVSYPLFGIAIGGVTETILVVTEAE